MPCSIERMPARIAFLMPSVAGACAMTAAPAAEVGAARGPHGGDATVERALEIAGGGEELVAEGLLQVDEQVDGRDDHVDVAVEHAGEHGAAAGVQDAAALDDHVGLGERRPGPVEHPPALEQGPVHGPYLTGLPPWSKCR